MRGHFFSISSVSVLNFFGLVAGFFVNSFLAYRFGAGLETDAYFIASMVPTFFIYLMGFDSIKGLARTLFNDINNGKRSESLSDAFSNLFNVIFAAGALVSILAIIMAPFFVRIIAPGASIETQQLAISLCRVMIPSVLMIGLANLNASVLNMWGQFFFPSLGLFFQKVCIIVSLLIFCHAIGIYSAALGMVFGSVVSLIVLFLPLLLSEKISYTLKFERNSSILKDFFRLFSPLLFLLLIMQVNSAVIQFFGSFFQQGTITKLGYAKTIASVMIPVLVTPVLSVYLNDFCKYISDDDGGKVARSYNKVYRILALLLGFFLVLQFSFSESIISLLFQRGAFTGADVTVTSHYYLLFLIGIPFQAYGLLANYLLLAAKRTDLIMKVGIYTVCTNVIFSGLLAKAFGPVGIAIGSAMAWAVHGVVFHFQARKVSQGDLLVASSVWSLKVVSVFCFLFTFMFCFWDPVKFRLFDSNLGHFFNIGVGAIVLTSLFIALAIIVRVDEVFKAIRFTRSNLFR